MKVFFVVLVALTVVALTDGSKVVDKEARKAAKAEKKCNKFIKKYEGCLKKGFKSNIGCGAGDGGDEEVEAGDKPTGWSKHEGKYLGGYSSGVAKYDTLAQAQAECVKRTDCGGITFETRGSKKFTLRKGTDLRDSPSAEISWEILPNKPAGWSKHEGKYLGGYSSGVAKYDTLAQAQAECVKRTDCGGITFETRGSKKFTLRKGTDLRDSPSAEISWKLSPKLSGAWSQIPGGLRVISKGKSGVWGVNANQNIYKLNADGKSWTMIAGGLTQVASGAEVWGVNAGDNIYKYLGNNKWQQMPGKLTNVDVSDSGNVWGVNRGQKIYRWLGSSWQNIPGAAIQVSVGNSGVWVVNAGNDIYYRTETRGDPNSAGAGWVKVPGKLKWIASGKDIVVGVNANNDIFYRDGVSDAAPTGTKWVKINGKLSQIEVYDDEVVGTNPAQNIFRTPYNGAPPKPKPQTKPAPKPEAPAEELSKKDLKKCGKLEKKLKKCEYEC